MKKAYNDPEVMVTKFEYEDIMTVSVGDDVLGNEGSLDGSTGDYE